MQFKARTEREFLGFLLLLTIMSIFTNDYSKGLLVLQALLAVFCFIAMFIQFSLTIHDDSLTYSILIFKRKIYNKDLLANQITTLKLSRFGWATKGAVIKVNKGINIRIGNFEPDNTLEYLTAFARKHSLPIIKTKDYSLLENKQGLS